MSVCYQNKRLGLGPAPWDPRLHHLTAPRIRQQVEPASATRHLLPELLLDHSTCLPSLVHSSSTKTSQQITHATHQAPRDERQFLPVILGSFYRVPTPNYFHPSWIPMTARRMATNHPFLTAGGPAQPRAYTAGGAHSLASHQKPQPCSGPRDLPALSRSPARRMFRVHLALQASLEELATLVRSEAPPSPSPPCI